MHDSSLQIVSVCVLYIASSETQSSLICCYNRYVKHSVMYILFVEECTVQFNTEDFHCGRLCDEEI
jgi:hypothetical protein